jgi:hypothetical protein
VVGRAHQRLGVVAPAVLVSAGESDVRADHRDPPAFGGLAVLDHVGGAEPVGRDAVLAAQREMAPADGRALAVGGEGDHRADVDPQVEPARRDTVDALALPLAQRLLEARAADRVAVGQDHAHVVGAERGHALPVAGDREVAPLRLEPLDLADRAQILNPGGLAREVVLRVGRGGEQERGERQDQAADHRPGSSARASW